MIEIYLLEQLDAFAACGTLSEAAEKLHMTQPTLTRSMQKLEDYFGFPLFDRDKKRLSLNSSGKLLAEYAHKLLASEKEMEHHVRSHHRSLHTLHIGSIAPGPLMVLLPTCTVQYPEITIASSVDTEKAIIQGLLSDEYGVIILSHPMDDPRLHTQAYISEHLNLSVSLMHPAAARKSITFREMDGQNFIMLSQVGIWADVVKAEMPASSFYKQESMEALKSLTTYSDLPSFTTDVSVVHVSNWSNGRVNIPFSDPSATIRYYLVCKKENTAKWKQLLES